MASKPKRKARIRDERTPAVEASIIYHDGFIAVWSDGMVAMWDGSLKSVETRPAPSTAD